MPDLVLKQAQRGEIARPWPHRQIQGGHGLQVVVEHIGPRRDDRLDRPLLAQEVGSQDLDRDLGIAGTNGPDNLGKMRGTAIGKVVAIDRGNHDVGKSELGNGIGKAGGLGVIQRARSPRFDVAEGAGARAHIPHDHHGGVPRLPAFADVRTPGFDAHGVETVVAHDPASFGVSARARRLDADPIGLAQGRRVLPMRLLGMARAGCRRIED